MTATYNLSLLPTDTTTQIRFYLGDTDITVAQLQDEEIAFAYSQRGNVFGATAMCALALQAKYARLVSISADGVSQSMNQKSQQFKALFDEYQRKETIYTARPYLGGVSIADMLATLSNLDRVPDVFRLGINDDPPSDGVAPDNDRATTTSEIPL